MFRLPGYQSNFYLENPIVPGGNFTWGEALHGGERIPRTKEEVENIIALATKLQVARQQINRPFHITSWYRPEPFNSRAGGAKYSQHLTGKAVDLWVDGYSGFELRLLLHWWKGGLGTYSNLPKIIHLDIGAHRRW